MTYIIHQTDNTDIEKNSNLDLCHGSHTAGSREIVPPFIKLGLVRIAWLLGPGTHAESDELVRITDFWGQYFSEPKFQLPFLSR